MEGVFVYDIDDLDQIAEEHRTQRISEVPRAEKLVEKARDRYLGWQESLAVVPTLVELRQHFEEIRAAEVRHFASKIPGLDDVGRQRLDQLTQTMVNKLLHVPTSRLKARAADGMGAVLASSLRYLFDLRDSAEREDR